MFLPLFGEHRKFHFDVAFLCNVGDGKGGGVFVENSLQEKQKTSYFLFISMKYVFFSALHNEKCFWWVKEKIISGIFDTFSLHDSDSLC